MKVLMLGDIVARPGRNIVKELLAEFKNENGIDWVIANGENLAGGLGLNKKTAKEMFDAGVDILTSGNHIWKLDEAIGLLEKKDGHVLRPANYPPQNPGEGFRVFTNALGQKILVINLIGRVFFREDYDCPFRIVDEILDDKLKKEGINIKSLDGIFVDFHAEATSEKYAMAYHLSKRVTAVVGTHTHVATADEQILDDHTAYITDLGMTGATDTILGVEKDIVIKQFLTQLPQRFVWKTTGEKILSGVIIKTKKGSGKALSIERILLKLD